MQLMFIQAHGSLAFTMESERSPIPTFTHAEKHHKLWTPFPIFAVLTTLVAPLFVTTSFDEDSQERSTRKGQLPTITKYPIKIHLLAPFRSKGSTF
ncbi:hypothetical protein BGW80DRAFT_1461258 [Lactifluus volemus]|nr:hypothetical protein BGW80DRAFT_1461258 [Lactifluus volemus]